MAKSVLVMGGTRFVGLHAVNELVRRGYEVTVLNRGSHPEVLPPGVTRIVCDRKDSAMVREKLGEAVSHGGFDAVVDPSAYVPEDLSTVVEVLKGHTGGYAFISTGSVYKSLNLYPWDEGAPKVQDASAGAYGWGKKQCEDLLQDAFVSHGFPCVSLRPGYIYGPHNTVYREAFFFDRIRAGRPVLVPGTGVVLSQFGYVDDLANLIILGMENPTARGQAYNFAGATMRPLDDYVKACAAAVSEAAGEEFPADIVHYWPSDVQVDDSDVGRLFPYRWRVNTVRDISKARYELGYEEETTLDQGLVESARWYFGEVAKGKRPFPAPDYSAENRILALMGR